MKRFLTAMLAIAAMFAIPAVVAASGTATCDYNATSHEVTVAITGDVMPYLGRDTAGHITLNNAWCDNAATVTNTDSVIVTGDVASQGISIGLANKGFKPGRTDEAGKSDEIEFTINLGGGTMDTLTFVGTDAVNKIDLGQNNSQFGIVRRINLNAGETTGIDSDVAVINVEKVTVITYGGNDVVRARGKAGTGPDAFSLPLWVYGGPGDDIIKGGEAADHLYGDQGKDKVWGFGNGDSVVLNDGEGGDVGYGGAGIDDCIYDPGDTWNTN
jgi:RTX calcium-binding nonapeptide repeat (4 copies)